MPKANNVNFDFCILIFKLSIMPHTKHFIILVIVGILLAGGVIYAAEVTVHVDEKELASALITQIVEQLNNAKNLIFKHVPQDIWNRAWELGAQVYILVQKTLKEVSSIFIHAIRPNN